MRSTSSLNNLAGKVNIFINQLYSNKTNTVFTPKKAVMDSTVSKNASTGKLLPENFMVNP